MIGTNKIPSRDIRTTNIWSTHKGEMIIPYNEIAKVIGNNNVCQTTIGDYSTRSNINTICFMRLSRDIHWKDSFLESIHQIYLLTVGSCIKSNNLQKDDSVIRDLLFDLNTFKRLMTEYVTPMNFRYLGNGAIYRLFQPTDLTTYKASLNTSDVESWLEQYKLDFGDNLYSVLKSQISTIADDDSSLLLRWYISHTRFIQYLQDDDEPKTARIFWDLLRIFPWYMISNYDKFSPETRNEFRNGVNVIILRKNSIYSLVCPPDIPIG